MSDTVAEIRHCADQQIWGERVHVPTEQFRRWADKLEAAQKRIAELEGVRDELKELRHACLAAIGYLKGYSILTEEQMMKTLISSIKLSPRILEAVKEVQP